MFTSGLSVNEFALLGKLGPQPLAQVMGASVVRTGWQYLPPLDPSLTYTGTISAYAPSATGYALTNRYAEPSMGQLRAYRWRTEVVCELEVLTAAWNLARSQALARLRDEAAQAGADAVVGVRSDRGDHDFGKGIIEYLVTGTAIRVPGSAGASEPTLTGLSVQDYWRLRTGGQEPVGLVACTAVVFGSPPRSTRIRRLRTTMRNQELGELSAAFGLAREKVRSRLREQVSAGGGTGAVGVELSHSVAGEKLGLGSSVQAADRRGWHLGRFGMPYRVSGRGDAERGGWVITMHAAGTAIRPRAVAQPPAAVKPAIRLGSR